MIVSLYLRRTLRHMLFMGFLVGITAIRAQAQQPLIPGSTLLSQLLPKATVLSVNSLPKTDVQQRPAFLRLMPAYPRSPTANPVAADLYYEQCYGFFCKMEWQTEKRLHVPVSFRLGSLAYVNHLEGK